MVQLQVSLTVVVLLLCSILVQAENTEELDSFLVAMQNAKANNGTPLAIDFEYATFFSELRAFHENTFEEVEICTEMMEQLQFLFFSINFFMQRKATTHLFRAATTRSNTKLICNACCNFATRITIPIQNMEKQDAQFKLSISSKDAEKAEMAVARSKKKVVQLQQQKKQDDTGSMETVAQQENAAEQPAVASEMTYQWHEALQKHKLLTLQEYMAILDDHKAQDVVVMDLQTKCTFAAYMIFVTAQSYRHMKVIANAAVRELRLRNIPRLNAKIEGADSDDWMLVDGGNVVLQVFSAQGRVNYDLERKWLFQQITEFEGKLRLGEALPEDLNPHNYKTPKQRKRLAKKLKNYLKNDTSDV